METDDGKGQGDPRTLPLLATLLLGLAIPATYYWVGYERAAAALDAELEFTVDRAEQVLADGQPNTAALRGVVHERSGDTARETRRILDVERNVIAEDGGPLPPPVLHQRAPLRNDQVVGLLEIRRSLRPLAERTALIALISAVIAPFFYALLWLYPYRAARLAMERDYLREGSIGDIQRSLSLLTATLESTDDGILVTDLYGSVVRHNRRYLELWRLPHSAADSSNEAFSHIVKQIQRPYPFLVELKKLRNEPERTFEMVVELKDGRFIDCRSRPQRVEGSAVGRVWMFRDISEHRRAEALLTTEELVLRAIVEGTSLPEVLNRLTRYVEERSGRLFAAIYLTDRGGGHLHSVSAPSLPQQFAYELGGPTTDNPGSPIAPALEQTEPTASEDLATDPRWTRNRQTALRLGLNSIWAVPVLSQDAQPLGIFCAFFRDPGVPEPYDRELAKVGARLAGLAVERKQAEESMEQLAHYDPVTDLPNRVLFHDRLNRALAWAQRNDEKLALMFIDLDRFKQINDTLGHEAGDTLLQTVAERLGRCVRDEDTVARLGGDEFTILLRQVHAEDDAAFVARKCLETLSAPIHLNDREVFVSASIGITVAPADGREPETLLKNADAAMYQAKHRGRDNFQFYTQQMNARALERLDMETGLRRALERNEFILCYQPKADLARWQTVGVEVLLRWEHGHTGLISPAEFVPTLEDTGLILPVGEWILRTACEQAVYWQRLGLPPIHIAVNLSGRQLQGDAILKSVRRVLDETGLDPAYLELEVTESLLMDDPQRVRDLLKQLRAMGVLRIDIDDFGTGYSSLSYLKQFPISTLKLDKSFIDELPHDNEDAAIARAVIGMAHSLDLKVIAEGVENDRQVEFLREEGCDEIQGFLFSPPLGAEEMTRMLYQEKELAAVTPRHTAPPEGSARR